MLVTKVPVVRLAGVLLMALSPLNAQSVNPTTTVPRTVRYTGSFHPADGLAVQPMEGVTIAVYADQAGGDPLWQETQNVHVDASGNFAVEMGATQNDGLPLDLLRTGEPRWVGVRVNRPGETEQLRVRLLSVPYALRASDAETLGGIPASAYLLNPSASVAGTSAEAKVVASAPASTNAVKPRVTSGNTNYLGLFTNSTDLGNSVLYQNGGKIGLNTTNPADYFHVAFSNTTGAFTGFAVQNLGSGAAAYSGMLFYDQNGALGQFQGFNNSTHEYRINNIASGGSINFMLGTSKFLVRSDGDIDIAGNIRKAGTPFITSKNSGEGLGLNALQNSSGLRANAVGDSALGSGAVNTGAFNNAFGGLALTSNTSGFGNNSFGDEALHSNSTGTHNSAFGDSALSSNQTGNNNTAVGAATLEDNTASDNTANGYGALRNNTTGPNNTANGSNALQSNTTGDDNTASGANALYNNTTGAGNTASGSSALFSNSTGTNNIAIGFNAGDSITTGNNNIEIGNGGTGGDTGIIRIGTPGIQTAFVAAGIRGATTGVGNAVSVMIDSNGQLGTVNSSRRFKEDIQDMGNSSSNLMHLCPVTYRYKQPYADGSKPLDYGLIAEEVAEIYPDLVVTNKDGQIETVQYQKLTPMLLNELQKQNQHVQQQDEVIRHQQERIGSLEGRLAGLEALLSGSAISGTGR